MANNIPRVPVREQDPEIRATNFNEVCYGYSKEEAMLEATRCLNCKKPACVAACPVSVKIPFFIHQVVEGNFKEAARIIAIDSSLPAICGRVCPQENQCEGRCVMGVKGESVAIGKLERFVADWSRENGVQFTEKKAFNGIKVAVIGSGPSGLACASDLAKMGYDVTIFDSRDKIGGVLQYGIPDFRLPKTILERYKKKLLEIGIKIRPNTTIGGALVIDDLFRDGYKAIFIGTGVWRPKKLGIIGESLGNVHFAIDFLANPSAYNLGQDVAIIGAGNTAMDVARTILRAGNHNVTIYARSKKIDASAEEYDYAVLDGTRVEFGMGIQRITPDGPVFRKNVFDDDGHIIGNEGDDILVHADSTIVAISQGPKSKLVDTTEGLKPSANGLLLTNEKGETTHSGIFAAGDVVLGAKTVVQAVSYAKMVAQSMDEYVQTLES